MSTSQLDRIVKGAPPPTSLPTNTPAPPSTTYDPTSNLPSSPGQIYLNLLILESSLRAQYLSLRARLRLYSVLMTVLAIWTLTFTYLLFLRPREDGKGTGGSPYWVVDMGEKVGWVGGVVTASLVWGTGMWERGVRWPRRWVGITNRGLRGFNLKVVVIRGPWWKEALGYLSLLDPLGWWHLTEVKGMRFEVMPKDIERSIGQDKEKDRLRKWEDGGREGWIEEDIAPGGDYIKLLLLPKPFSPDFREDWDNYRTTYWEKENERRARLRKIIKARNREIAKREGGWLWWTGWRGWQNLRGAKKADLEMIARTIREKGSATQLRKKRPESLLRDGSHSRSSSRSVTPEPDSRHPRRPGEDRLRRGSSSQGLGRKKKPTSNPSTASNGGAVPKPTRFTPRDDSRPRTPLTSDSSATAIGREPSLSKRPSNLSTASSSSDTDIKKEDTPPTDVEIKQEKS
ncbi:Nem1-Spo7 phosphatase regulatory subunit [Taxawa tesnikishii (nom. ined.)]|nr:Nem1-Spo7 phosphatase regulatory subunit [Dothideales sp. JES 119]